MDYVPEPSNPLYYSIKVPCLNRLAYDGLDFDSYPARCGWAKHRLLAGDFSEHPPETSAFLQNWLYFGTLWTVIGEIATKESYMKQDQENGNDVVTTELLFQHLCTSLGHIRRQLENPSSPGSTIVEKIESCLKQVSMLCRLAVSVDETKNFSTVWSLPSEIDLSIRALGQYLSFATFNALWDYRRASILSKLKFGTGQLPLDRMAAAGWCPSDVSMMAERFSPASLYYISSLRRVSKFLDHSRCSSRLCLARQVNVSTYTPKHALGCNEGDTCHYQGPSVQDVASIIDSGRIPLISIKRDETSQALNLRIEALKPGCHYIAISHVWSDGLGNPSVNALHQCQIRRLHTLLSELTSRSSNWDLVNMGRTDTLWNKLRGRSVPFWIDTLCIPVGNEYRATRSLAIAQMKDTYEQAYQVLVLDNELEKYSKSDLVEAFMRISVSGWMRRLWTLQEGVLARRLFINFKDGLLDIQDAYEEMNPSAKFHDVAKILKSTHGTPSNDASSFYWKLRSLRANVVEKQTGKMFGIRRVITPYDPVQHKTSEQCFAIMEAFIASRYRSTSREEDEFNCLGSLLGWNTHELSGLSMNKRMRALLEHQTKLPQGLLFVAGRRMQDVGWRWAPTRFGNNAADQINAPIADTRVGVRDGRGFCVEYPGLVLPIASSSQDITEIFVTTSNAKSEPTLLRIIRLCSQDHDRDAAGSEAVKFKIPALPVSERRICIIFWDATGHMNSGIDMAAAILSIPSHQTLAISDSSSAIVCDYEGLATVTVMDIHPEDGQLNSEALFVEGSIEIIHSKWLIQ